MNRVNLINSLELEIDTYLNSTSIVMTKHWSMQINTNSMHVGTICYEHQVESIIRVLGKIPGLK